MLSDTLVTNEVKDAAGAEIEFERMTTKDRSTEFFKKGELPGAEHRLQVSHQEVGSGINRRRRSRVGFSIISMGKDTLTPVTNSCYIVLDTPIGNQATYDDAKKVVANLLSFCATTGAATVVLFDCTGSGAKSLIEGSL